MVLFQRLQQLHHGVGFSSTHACQWFVEQQHIGFGGQDHGDFQLALNTVAQDGGGFVANCGQASQFQGAFCASHHGRIAVCAGEPGQRIEGCMGVTRLRCQHQIVPNGQRQEHIGFLIAAPQTLQRQAVVWPACDRLAFEPQLAAAGCNIAAEQMGERGFARTIGPNDGMQLVFEQGQRHIVHGQQAAKAFAQTFGLQQGISHLVSLIAASPSGLEAQ